MALLKGSETSEAERLKKMFQHQLWDSDLFEQLVWSNVDDTLVVETERQTTAELGIRISVV